MELPKTPSEILREHNIDILSDGESVEKILARLVASGTITIEHDPPGEDPEAQVDVQEQEATDQKLAKVIQLPRRKPGSPYFAF